MKKSLISLALAALSGAAPAQSNVTLYGRLDVSLAIAQDKVSRSSTTSMESGLLNTSLWGLRGSEDLGGGLKAKFVLENDFKIDNGSPGTIGSSFGKQAWLGLAGPWGALKLGRSDTAFDDIRDLAAGANLWDSDLTPSEVVYKAGLRDYARRANNQIRYESPGANGFSAGLSHSLDEQAQSVKKDVQAFNLRYRGGALDVGAGFQEQKNNLNPARHLRFTAVSAAYDMGALLVSGGVNVVNNALHQRDREWSIGVTIPRGALAFSAGYAHSTSKTAGVTKSKGSGYAMGATYALSMHTKVYVAHFGGDTRSGAGATVANQRLFAAGFCHDF